MSIRIRSASLESDGPGLIEFLRRNLAEDYDQGRFNWLYRQCPYGPPRAWVGEETGSGEIVAAAAAFPRRFYADGVVKHGYVLGDFCISGRHRSLGPALQLQRLCLELVNETSSEFCYDFPSAGMMAVYRRLGFAAQGKIVRFVRPLRAEGHIRRFVKSEIIANVLARPVNAFLRRRASPPRGPDWEMEPLTGRCGEEFDMLDIKMRQRRGISGARDSGFLNWRHLEYSRGRHEILVARRKGELMGFVAIEEHGNEGSIVDLRASDETNLVEALCCAATETLSKRSLAAVSLPAGQNHPCRPRFERAGFVAREASPLVSVARRGGFAPGADCEIMKADRDS